MVERGDALSQCAQFITFIGLMSGVSISSLLSMKDLGERITAIAHLPGGQISSMDYVFASGVHRSRMEVTYTERK